MSDGRKERFGAPSTASYPPLYQAAYLVGALQFRRIAARACRFGEAIRQGLS